MSLTSIYCRTFVVTAIITTLGTGVYFYTVDNAWLNQKPIPTDSEFRLTHNTPFGKHNASIARHNASILTHARYIPTHNTSIRPPNASIQKHNTSIRPPNASIQKHNASIRPHSASIQKHNTSIGPPNASIQKYNTSIGPHSASIQKHNASIEIHSASSQTHNTHEKLYPPLLTLQMLQNNHNTLQTVQDKRFANEGQRRPYFLTFNNTPDMPYFYNISGLKKGNMRVPKRIVYYNPPSWYNHRICLDGIRMCPVNSCQCSQGPPKMSNADAVIFNAVALKDPIPPMRPSNQVWIFSGIETQFHYSSTRYRSEKWRNVFNWTMTYRTDSDIPWPYNVLVPQSKTPNKDYQALASRKTKSAVWLVSKCHPQSKRQDYVRILQQYYDVDILGICGQGHERKKHNLTELFKDYKFYLSFENSFCKDYVTEKLFKIYQKDIDIIPVVRGGAVYSSLIPNGTYINTADFESPRKLADYLKYLGRNVTAYAEILRKKDEYVQIGVYNTIHSAFCDICVKLHNLNVSYNSYQNIESWLTKDICHAPHDLVD